MNQVYRTDYMNKAQAIEAQQWLSKRMQAQTGDPRMQFPPGWMPETGLVCLGDEDKLLAVVILYQERSSAVAVSGWCVANPENSPAVSVHALNLLLGSLPGYAKSLGAKHLLTYFANRGLNNILDEVGFSNGDGTVVQKYFNLER